MQFKNKYNFLGNFFICPIQFEIEGKLCKFTNVEAAYQAQKNPQIADKFSQIKGLEAKNLGPDLIITVPNWDEYYLYAMANALHAKFNNKILLSQLCAIKDPIIHENYWKDTYWGVDLYTKKGQNVLGKMLMNIRDNKNDINKLYDFIKSDLQKIERDVDGK